MLPRVARTLVALACSLVAARAGASADDEALPKPRATPPDTRAFHPTVALGLGYSHLLGSFESNFGQNSRTSWGAMPSLEVALPLNHSFAVALWADRGSYNRGTADCPRCRATSTAGGLAAVYHLLDGAPFDPWLSAGIGYRRTALRFPPTAQPGAPLTSYEYSGIDALRIEIGGDYFVTRLVGIGPYLGFTLGRYTARSPGPFPAGEQTTNGAFVVGIRVIVSPLSF